MFELKQYQEKAISELMEYFHLYINKRNKTISFESPTGSGKTFMITEFINRVIKKYDDTENICFIWASLGKGNLHIQSMNAVKKFSEGTINCSLINESFVENRRSFLKNELAFINWEKVVDMDLKTQEFKNNLVKKSEKTNLIDIINKTKELNYKIILIYDESHVGGKENTKTSFFKNSVINPDMILEMSATPLNSPDVKVELDDVIEEGMIKNFIHVNKGIKNDEDNLDSENLMLQKAYNLKKELKVSFEKEKSDVNPLILIQIPNKEKGEDTKNIIRAFFKKHDISEENMKIAFWCDNNDYIDKVEIIKNDSIIDVLVFKTAIATGWDCPRAHILVKFRETKSETFEVQTVGRILRMPETKKYNQDNLNDAYIFTNTTEFETKWNSYNPNKIKTSFSYIRKDVKEREMHKKLRLTSYYRSRKGDYNSATTEYGKFFENSFLKFIGNPPNGTIINKDFLVNHGFKFDIDYKQSILKEEIFEQQNIGKEKKLNKTINVDSSKKFFEYKFQEIIINNLNKLVFSRSESVIRQTIYTFIKRFTNIFSGEPGFVSNVIKFVVSNEDIFSELIGESTIEFRNSIEKQISQNGDELDFEIKESKAYNSETWDIMDSEKSLYQPLQVELVNGKQNKLEKRFIEYLEKSDEVDFFWKNGSEHMIENFGIPYNNGANTFQPDFLVRFIDGRIGIFDTKASNFNNEDTAIKQKALFNYINRIKSDRMKKHGELVGGIVVEDKNSFFFFESPDYKTIIDGYSNWKKFDTIFDEVIQNKNNKDYMKIIKEYEHELIIENKK